MDVYPPYGALDLLGNWDGTIIDSTTETRVHNSVNELTSRTIGQDPQISLTYDDAGNLTQDGDSDGDHKYVWDYRNRLIEVKEYQTDTWNTTAEYKYDAQGRRVLKVVTNKGDLNGSTRYLWGGSNGALSTNNYQLAGWQCLEERDGSGDLVARFTYSAGYIDAVAVQERDLNGDSDFGDAGEVVYYHQNTLFSVYAVTDANESVVERYRYDAYGGVTVLDADGSVDADGLSDVENPYTFTGRRLEAEMGLMAYRFRWHSTAAGRFNSRDPEGYADGLNLYSYVGNRPLYYTDPLGDYPRKKCECVCKWACKVGSGLPIAGEKYCYVLCMALCLATPEPGNPCSEPKKIADCDTCAGFLACVGCCRKLRRAGKIDVFEHRECNKQCKGKEGDPNRRRPQ